MRKYLAWDKETERINDVAALWGFNGKDDDIIIKSKEEGNCSIWFNQDRFIIMQCIDKKDINGKELHEGAIIKADIEMYGMEKSKDTEGLIGFIEYSSNLSHYHMLIDDRFDDRFIPISVLGNIEKIGIVGVNDELLGF